MSATSRLDAVERRLRGAEDRPEIRVLFGAEQIRSGNAAVPEVRSPAEALGLLAMLGHPISPVARRLHRPTARAEIVRRFGRVAVLGGSEVPPVGDLAGAVALLAAEGFRIAPSLGA